MSSPRYVTFTAGANSIQIDMPTYGYSCEIVMPISSAQDANGGYSFFDPPASAEDSTLGTFDYRILNTATWRIPVSQQISLSAFFRDANKGRGEPVTMTLQANSGFYPFGPDLGDTGAFTVQLLSQDQSGRLGKPWNYFENSIYLVLITPPVGYSLPAEIKEGNLSIGTVTGLRYCDFSPKTLRNIKSGLTLSGVPYVVDGTTGGDSYETSWTQLCNQGKSASLTAFLVSTSGRASDISIVTPSNFYVAGIDNWSSGTYNMKLLGSSPSSKTISLKLTHDGFNRWSIPLNFWMNPN